MIFQLVQDLKLRAKEQNTDKILSIKVEYRNVQ